MRTVTECQEQQKVADMPDHARVWVYQSDRLFSEAEISEIENAGRRFIAGWAAHGTGLKAAFKVRHGLFLVLVVDEQQAAASGCSIDKSVTFIKDLSQRYGADLLGRRKVAWRDGTGSICNCSLDAFEKQLSSGEVNGSTIVFNNLVSTAKELLESWEVPLEQSWHVALLANR